MIIIQFKVNNMEDFPEQFLQQDETLLWVNKPHITISWLARGLVKSQKFLIGVIAILLIVTVISPVRADSLPLFVICLLPIVTVLELWFIFKLIRAYNRVAYAITNQRLIQFWPQKSAIHAFVDIQYVKLFHRTDEFDGYTTIQFSNQFSFARISDADAAIEHIEKYGSLLPVHFAEE